MKFEFLLFFFLSDYYFSDANLTKDVFLRQRMDSGGWLPVSLIASFNRMQKLSTDITFIVQAVKDSEIVEVKDGIKVGSQLERDIPFVLSIQSY